MADPTQLQGQIFQTFGQGVTGIDYSDISRGIQQDREFKRKEIDSLYDVGAELDASAYSALQGEMGSILDQIDANELIAGTPEFRRAQSRLNTLATDLKQTQDLTQGVLRDASNNPQNVSYIVNDEQGNPVDLGYEGLIEAARGFGTGNYSNPEQYISGGSQFLSGIGERIDENDLRRNVQQSVDADVKRAFEEIGLEGSELKEKIFAYRNGLVDLKKKLGNEAFNAIRDNNKQRYQEGIRSKYAIDRGRNAVDQGKNVEDYANEYIEGFIPRAQSDVSQFTVPAPRSTAADRRRGETLERQRNAAKDVKAAVHKLQTEGDIRPVSEYLNAYGYEVDVDTDTNTLTIASTRNNEERVIDLRDARAIYNAMGDIDDNISREAIDYWDYDPETGVTSVGGVEVQTDVDGGQNQDPLGIL